MKKININIYINIAIIAVFILIAIIGPSIIQHDPYKVNMANCFEAPGGEHLLGTDNLGRCVFCRIISGSTTSIFSSLVVVGISFVIGVILGIIAGFFGGALDAFISKLTLVFQAFPSFVLAISIAGILGGGLMNGIIALCAVYWTTYAKLSRSLVISIKQENYILAARLDGIPFYRIFAKYIMPNILGTMLVTASLDLGSVVLSMAGLSFLGLGAARPTAEWGAVMSEARDYLQNAPWIIIFNGIALFIIVVGFQRMGDNLRDKIDYKNKKM